MIYYDVLIIGGGVSGCSIAMNLSKYDLSIGLLEKEEDVCYGTSKANSAIVHAGFDAEPGSLMAKMNLEGNLMMEELCKDLQVPFKRNGSLVLCFSEEEIPHLQKLLERGIANGVKELQILSKEEVKTMEPNVSDEVVAALYAPTGGIVYPFELCIGMAEVAAANGVNFMMNSEVVAVDREDAFWRVSVNETSTNNCPKTAKDSKYTFSYADDSHATKEQLSLKEEGRIPDGAYYAKYVINAAGVYADVIHNMVSEHKITITPRKGDYVLFNKTAGELVRHTIFQLPGNYGKGVLVTPTVYGNLLIGPNAKDIIDKSDTITTVEGLNDIVERATLSIKNIPLKKIIRSFSGLRAHEEHHDFIIKELEDTPGFFDCAAIESPGLTSSPAIGKLVCELVINRCNAELKKNYITTRNSILNPNDLSEEDRIELIGKNSDYGVKICLCEEVSKAEILDSIRRPIGAKSLDGVKHRTRAGMGACQQYRCGSVIREILSKELEIPIERIKPPRKSIRPDVIS